MSRWSVIRRIVTIIRWIARIWSILILALAVLVIIAPDPYTVQPVPLAQQMLMGLFGVAVLGSILAWRWEGLGGAIAVASGVAYDVATRDFSGGGGVWSEVLTPASPLVFVFGFPGILFLVCWALSRGKRA
jgi:hypothetical protein